MREIWVYKNYTDEPVFILKNPSINLLRKFKMKGLYLIPRVIDENYVKNITR